jgi:hypothetical protein
MLAGDRFYGTTDLVTWCQRQGWRYRLRLKGNLCVFQQAGDDKSLDQMREQGIPLREKLRFRAGMVTYGFLHEKGHPEPWYIAMDSTPTEYKTRDYGLRWGIENMFSDFKSRGFSRMHTHIRIAERLERLVLVLSLALHWAVSAGLAHEKQHPDHAEKRGPKNPKDPLSRFLNAASGRSIPIPSMALFKLMGGKAIKLFIIKCID